MKLETGMIGLGTVAEDHLRALNLNPLTNITAVCDIDEELVSETAAEYDTNGYTDYEGMFDKEDLDWVHVCTPVQTHLDIASDVIDQGIDVLVEKPITENFEQYQTLQARADEKGVRVTEVHSALFHYEVRWLRKKVREGAVGDVKSVEVYFGEDLRPDSLFRGEWVLDLPGGELEEGFPHPIYSALRVGGYPESPDDVNVSHVLAGEYEHDFAYDGVEISFSTEKDALCSIHIQSDVPNQKTIRVHGTEGTIEADITYHSLLKLPTTSDGRYLHVTLSGLRRDLNRNVESIKNLLNTLRLYVNEVSYYNLADVVDKPIGTMNRQMYQQIDAEARSILNGSDSPIPRKETEWTSRIINIVRESAQDV